MVEASNNNKQIKQIKQWFKLSARSCGKINHSNNVIHSRCDTMMAASYIRLITTPRGKMDKAAKFDQKVR